MCDTSARRRVLSTFQVDVSCDVRQPDTAAWVRMNLVAAATPHVCLPVWHVRPQRL